MNPILAGLGMLGGALAVASKGRSMRVMDRPGGAPGQILEMPSNVTWIEKDTATGEFVVVLRSAVGDVWFEHSRWDSLAQARKVEKKNRPIDVGQ